VKNHWWTLNSTGVPVAPADVKAVFEKLRDHYSNTALVAGLDPRDLATGVNPAACRKVKYDGHENVAAHMDRGIAALVAITSGMTKPVHATIRGVCRTETDRRPGDELIVSVSVAQEGAGDTGIDGFEG
jgi:hypothetical protein